jgi:hypothetical protein
VIGISGGDTIRVLQVGVSERVHPLASTVVVMPDVFDANELLIVGNRWVLVEGRFKTSTT